MRGLTRNHVWQLGPGALTVVLVLAAPAWAQQQQTKSAADETKAGPVVRTFGAQGGYRTEVTSEIKGSLGEDDRRQLAVLTAQVFQHIDEAREALDGDDMTVARREVENAWHAIKAIRAIEPKTTVHTRTVAPDGAVVYEDSREVQEDIVPLFEGMIHAQTLAPIVDAKRDAEAGTDAEVKGVRLLESESIRTEAFADLGMVTSQLRKASKALEAKKADAASEALGLAQVRGVDFRYSRDNSPLAAARDAMWLARRALEENNPEQARLNLNEAHQRLRIYREIAPKERQSEVDQMVKEANQLENQLHKETATSPASQAERSRQGTSVTRWWEQMNGWFKKHL